MNTKLIITIGAVALLTSCAKDESENVNQDSIYTIYELYYNTDTDITTARTTFRFGGPTGTLLDLNDPAYVQFEGNNLSYNSVTGTHKKDFSGFTTNGTFVYKDLDNNTFTNATGTIDVVSFPAVDTISSGGSYSFVWSGNALAAGETMTLTIDGTMGGNFEVFSTSLVGATEIVLSAAKLQNLGIGDASCILQRAYNQSTVAQGTSEGGRMAHWYTTTKTIYIDN